MSDVLCVNAAVRVLFSFRGLDACLIESIIVCLVRLDMPGPVESRDHLNYTLPSM